jgi:hypothetical protein
LVNDAFLFKIIHGFYETIYKKLREHSFKNIALKAISKKNFALVDTMEITAIGFRI